LTLESHIKDNFGANLWSQFKTEGLKEKKKKRKQKKTTTTKKKTIKERKKCVSALNLLTPKT